MGAFFNLEHKANEWFLMVGAYATARTVAH